MRKVLFIVTFLIVIATLAYSQTGITGRWEGVVPPDGFPIKMALKMDGTGLTGMLAVDRSAPEHIREGKIDGNTISFRAQRDNDAASTVSFTGKVNGDEIALSADFPFPPNLRHITMKRVKDLIPKQLAVKSLLATVFVPKDLPSKTASWRFTGSAVAEADAVRFSPGPAMLLDTGAGQRAGESTLT